MIAQILFLAGGLLALIALIQIVSARSLISESTILAVVGVVLGAAYAFASAHAPEFMSKLAPLVTRSWPTEAYLWIFLPPLIFQAALTTDVRAMIPDAAPILLLAVVAVFVATGLVGGALEFFSGHGDVTCLLLAASIATTDPSAVIAIFRNIGAPARLTRLVEGESLFNDAAAVAIVGAVLGSMSGSVGDVSAIKVLANIFLSIIGGGLAGYVAGRALVALLPAVDCSPITVATLTMALPYPLYVGADEFLNVSGVIAAAAAGLVIGALGPTRLAPSNWGHLNVIWTQTAMLAGASVFLLAAMRAPPLLYALDIHELFLRAMMFVASLAARLAVLFGLFPFLRWLRLTDPVDRRYKYVIAWGGLRGAITLVLALSLSENEALPPRERVFIGALASAFVLANLFINGLSLRGLIKALELNKLSSLQQAVQKRAAVLSAAEVNYDIEAVAKRFDVPKGVIRSVQQSYEAEVTAGSAEFAFENALTERERLWIGLIILANKEHSLIPDYASGKISASNLDAMVLNTCHMIEATRQEGRIGYNRAAAAILEPPFGLKLGRFLSRRFGRNGILLHALADQFELLICRRAVLTQLAAFNSTSLETFLGSRMSALLDDILRGRLKALDAALANLSSSYGADFAQALEKRLLLLFALGRGVDIIETLKSNSIISAEIASNINKKLDQKWRSTLSRPSKSLMADLDRNTASENESA